jgi:hypothetical protein
MAKDAQGHGSETRGSTFDNINAQRKREGFKPMSESRRGIHNFLDYMAGQGPMPEVMAKTLAGGHPKSVPVDVHPSMTTPSSFRDALHAADVRARSHLKGQG